MADLRKGTIAEKVEAPIPALSNGCFSATPEGGRDGPTTSGHGSGNRMWDKAKETNSATKCL